MLQQKIQFSIISLSMVFTHYFYFSPCVSVVHNLACYLGIFNEAGGLLQITRLFFSGMGVGSGHGVVSFISETQVTDASVHMDYHIARFAKA